MTHKFAKFLILAASALGLSALPALADSACTTYSNLAQIESAGSCFVTSGGVTLDFSSFDYTPGGNDPILNASGIGVSVETSPDGPGLSFNPAIVDTDGQSTDVNVEFTVTDETPGSLISDVYIALTGAYDSGTGSTTTYTETICGGAEDQCILYTEQPSGPGTDLISLIGNTATGGPVSSLRITKDADAVSGATGVSDLSGFVNEYSTVPEPRAVSLVLGLALLAGFAIFKRRQVAQN